MTEDPSPYGVGNLSPRWRNDHFSNDWSFLRLWDDGHITKDWLEGSSRVQQGDIMKLLRVYKAKADLIILSVGILAIDISSWPFAPPSQSLLLLWPIYINYSPKRSCLALITNPLSWHEISRRSNSTMLSLQKLTGSQQKMYRQISTGSSQRADTNHRDPNLTNYIIYQVSASRLAPSKRRLTISKVFLTISSFFNWSSNPLYAITFCLDFSPRTTSRLVFGHFNI